MGRDRIFDSCFIQKAISFFVAISEKDKVGGGWGRELLNSMAETGKTKILQKVQWINLTQGWKEDGIWQGEGEERGKILSLSE